MLFLQHPRTKLVHKAPKIYTAVSDLNCFDLSGIDSCVVCSLLQVENTDVLVDGCLFDSCYASKKGGGFHQEDGYISVVDSLFYNNVAGSTNEEAGETKTKTHVGRGDGLRCRKAPHESCFSAMRRKPAESHVYMDWSTR